MLLDHFYSKNIGPYLLRYLCQHFHCFVTATKQVTVCPEDVQYKDTKSGPIARWLLFNINSLFITNKMHVGVKTLVNLVHTV